HGGMGALEAALQELHEAGKRIEISWLWDGGVEVNAEGGGKNFRLASEALPWLQHLFGLKDRGAGADALVTELQKIYDSEINITIRTGGKKVFVGWGTTSRALKPKGQSPRCPKCSP